VSADRTDVLVVGGGAVGLSAAWYLLRAGCEVRIVSRDRIGVGASAGNAGMIVPSHVVPLSAPGVIAQGLRWLANPESPFHVRLRPDPDLARWIWRFRAHCTPAHVAYAAPILRTLSMTSVDLFSGLQDEIGDFGWRQTGLMMLYRTEKYRVENLKAADTAESLGLRVRRLDGRGVLGVEPDLRSDADGGVLYEDDGRIDPEAFLSRLAVELERRGVEIRDGVTVRSVGKRIGGTTTVHTDRGDLGASTVVLAAGAWGGRTGPVRLPVQPAKGYSVTVDASGEGPGIPMILSEEKVTITPLPGRLRFGGTLSLAGFDASVDPRRVRPIRAQVVRYRPDLSPADVEGLAVWSGFRPASPDGLPIVGRLRPRTDIVVATGHGMMGMTLAPVTGRIVADLVTGERNAIDPAPLSPYRF
jgi:D-amino-acid dehydrogenase